jgi:DNA-binding transcriptional ArsR family regulator
MVTITMPKRAAPRPPSDPPDFHRAAERLKQVSDLTRLRVLLLLGDGERSVGSLSSEISCSMSALSRHLAFLRLAGLVTARRDAQRKVYDLTDSGLVLRRVVMGLVA